MCVGMKHTGCAHVQVCGYACVGMELEVCRCMSMGM